MNGIKRLFVRHVENNLVKYIIATMFFCVGVVLGVLAAMGGEHTRTVTEEVKNLCAAVPDTGFNSTEILKTSFLKNLRNISLVFVGGFSVWLMPLSFAVLFITGFSQGFTVCCMTSGFGVSGFGMAFSSVFPSLVLTVPVTVVMSVMAVNQAVKRKYKHIDGGDNLAYVLCFLILFLVTTPVILADAFAVPEIIRQICAGL